MNYGMPYKGSKNKIAPWILEHLPESDNLYDLFGGGGAITHCAALSGKYKTIHYNDLIPGLTNTFKKAVNGEYKNYTDWVSREDFLNSDDIFVKMIWSFGNNCSGYMYSPQIEQWKKAFHYAVLFKDYSYFKEFGIEISSDKTDTKERRLDILRKIKANHEDYKQKYIKWYLEKYNDEKIKEKRLQKLQTLESLQSLERLQNLQRLESLENLERLERLQSLEKLEKLERLQSLEKLEKLENIKYYEQSYDEFEIPENSVIYCDIPYKGTAKYLNEFDYEKFYKWACEQTVPIYISEYNMPEDRFKVVAEKEKSVSLSATTTGKVIEKIFIPKR